MIDKKIVEDIVKEFFVGKDLFLVSVKITKNNVITITIDGDNGVKISDCVNVSKYVEKTLENNIEENFELNVTSFGLEEYFILERQYGKNINQNLEVVFKDGTKQNGKLVSFDGENIGLQTKKQSSPTIYKIREISKARVLISLRKE